MTAAFDPATIGRYTTRNRVVMAPMTRSRAYGAGQHADPADGGLLRPARHRRPHHHRGHPALARRPGLPQHPGLHSAEQVAGWRLVTDAVHAKGGLIFAQLMHTGRIGHPDLYDDDLVPVSASAVAAAGTTYTASGPQELVTPQPLTTEEITTTIADFAAAARNAIEAGFDGVELHGANGYLLHQFLSTNANVRDDEWGGEGRIRFVVEVSKAVADAIGADRVGLRISPANPFNDIVEDGHRDTYRALVTALEPDRPGLPAHRRGPGHRADARAARALAGHAHPQPVHPGRLHRPRGAQADRERLDRPGVVRGAVPGQPRPARRDCRPAARSTTRTTPPRTAATSTATPTTRSWATRTQPRSAFNGQHWPGRDHYLVGRGPATSVSPVALVLLVRLPVVGAV